jgi:hypothetical protein
MGYLPITEANASSFIGAEVEFHYGAMHGSEKGWVVGQKTTQWGTELLAMTNGGALKSISGFSDIGIGVRHKTEA